MEYEDKTKEQLIQELIKMRQETDELKLYKHVLEQLPVSTIIYDKSGKLIYRNKASKDIDGYENNELVGLTRDEYLKQLQIDPSNISMKVYPKTVEMSFSNGIFNLTETTLLSKEKLQKNVLLIGDFVIDDENNLIGACGCTLDISDYLLKQKQAENALLESEERYRLLFNKSNDAILVHELADKGLHGKFVEVNDIACKTLGYSKKELLELSPYDIKLNEAQDNSPQLINKLLSEKHALFERFHITKDGTQIPVEVNAHLFYFEGKPTILSIVRDITERKRAEKALKDQLYFLQTLIDNIPSPIYYKDDRSLYLGCNTAFAEQIGFTKENVVGKSVYDIYPEDLAAKYAEMDLILFRDKGVQTYEYYWPSVDGLRHDCILNKNIYLNTDGTVAALIGVITDITGAKQAEKELRESVAQYRDIFNATTDAFVIMEIEGTIVEVNPQACMMHGYSYEEMIALYVKDIIHAEYYHVFEQFKTDILTTGYYYGESIDVRKDGSSFPVEVRGCVFNFKGKKHLLAVIRDITERKQAEEALKSERLRLFSLLDGLPALVYLQAPDYSIRFSNHYFWEHFDKPKNKLCYEVLSGLQKPCEKCPTFDVFETKNPQNWEWSQFDGNSYQMYNYPFIDVDGSLLVLVLGIDVTEQKRLENEMARLDRLNLIGEMAAGIAHEIRNPMTTVRGFLQMLGGKKEYANHKEYFSLMIDELDRANSIITEFLSLAKNKHVDLKMQNLNPIVESLLPLIKADAIVSDKYINTSLEKTPDLLLDEKEIRQLILNLVRNGLEAISPGSNLNISVCNDGVDVVLAVQDRGCGINSEVLKMIGTPFFTTKDQGSGLGLAVCYSIANRHNAVIKVQTGAMGTTFYVIFKGNSDVL